MVVVVNMVVIVVTGQDSTVQYSTGRDGTGQDRDNRDNRDDKDERQVRREKLERQEDIKAWLTF